MRRTMLRWLAAFPLLLLAAGCGGTPNAGAINTKPVATVSTLVDANSEIDTSAVTTTVTITLTDEGFEPGTAFIPAGRGVQIVIRNAGTKELHFKVEGVTPQGLRWFSDVDPNATPEPGVTLDEHALHHTGTYVNWRATSPSGIEPDGTAIHDWVEPGGRSLMIFVVNQVGTFKIYDPLNPDRVGRFTVF